MFCMLLLCGFATTGYAETAREKLSRLICEYKQSCDGADRAKIVSEAGSINPADTCGAVSRFMVEVASSDCDQRVVREALDELGDDARSKRSRCYVAKAVKSAASAPGAFGESDSRKRLGNKADRERRELDKLLSR